MNPNNGLQHAASLGTINSSIKTSLSTQNERNYDSDDGNVSRKKPRHISSSELYAKPSQYSKFDIKEQYCLTDRQLNTIDCSRRDRFFGCLSGRTTPQSLLGGCVGRRMPSDENLAVYAPYYKYPRYPHPYLQSNASFNSMDWENFYFRRQPASILSTSKIIESANPMYWTGNQSSFYNSLNYRNSNDNMNYLTKSSLYETPSSNVPGITGRSPRTKHVSFARSHTLTSFDDMNVGFRSAQYINAAKSQERLLGSKVAAAYNPCYETIPAYVQDMHLLNTTSSLRIPPKLPTAENANFNQNHLDYTHHKYLTNCGQEKYFRTQQPKTEILSSRLLSNDMTPATFMPITPKNVLTPRNSEVIVIEKKFRHPMKTQATQTVERKHKNEKRLDSRPRTEHRVKVVSQGAQTNGFPDSKSLLKTPTNISPNFNVQAMSTESIHNNEMARNHRIQSDESQIKSSELCFTFYQAPSAPPAPPPQECRNHNRKEPQQQIFLSQKDDHFYYESNSLPRRTCSYRSDNDFHSLPRRDFQYIQNTCKHITECSELLGNVSPELLSDLLPPPQEYCHDEEDSLNVTQTYPKDSKDCDRRKSLVPIAALSNDSPFRRDDFRRKSMPACFHRDELFDYKFSRNLSNEEEIIIDFKPTKRTQKSTLKGIKSQQQFSSHYLQVEREKQNSLTNLQNRFISFTTTKHIDEPAISHDPIYENVQIGSNNIISAVAEADISDHEQVSTKSAPASPLKDELLPLIHPSTYPSSDSLANDNTRDHSESNWNESEVTVLIAEKHSEASLNSHHLLTPSTRRKYLLLQHQQRSSIDTETFDLEEQFTDQSPSYNQTSNTLKVKPPVVTPRESTIMLNESNLSKLISPSIEVTTAYDDQLTSVTYPVKMSSNSSPRESRRNINTLSNQLKQIRPQEKSIGHLTMFPDQQISTLNGNADASECSTNTNTNTNTNTEEYATCTDTSKHTAVSTQSSQMDRTNAESSFESASSLHSSKCDPITDDLELNGDTKADPNKDVNSISKTDSNLSTYTISNGINGNNNANNQRKSPNNSVSSPSSGSYNRSSSKMENLANNEPEDIIMQYKETIRIKMESISDDERSEICYSSSGYYESPQDDEYQKTKIKRFRSEEERRRRKSSMKIDIEKENIRALMSPTKKEHITRFPSKPRLLQPLELHSPVKLKRFRPKVRRQLRRLSRDDIVSHKSPKETENLLCTRSQSEAIVNSNNLCVPPLKESEEKERKKSLDSLSPFHNKTLSETTQLKDKSVESLNRSVSPGSDSVFYSEADANIAEPKNVLNFDDTKQAHASNGLYCDSVESLPYIDNEPDIVKPPSDFADSPTINKTTQRLYKKMDKRLRSEERYSAGDRGRHYKYRKENNIRAKSEERNQEVSKKISTTLRMTGSSPCILPASSFDVKQQTIYIGHYDCSRYTRLTDSDIWVQLNHQSLEKHTERRNSTESERSFCSKYQVILHRLVQRRCTLEMYRRQKSDVFRVDKTLVVKSDSGEFGFRIHGSKPVVVAAIEPETPAESSGLEVGDIIISVNGVQVLDKHHTEVVKIAHDGCEKLELEVARTLGVLINERQEPPIQIIYSGQLWRQSGQASGSPNNKKWLQRWFVLRSDNCLYYYKTEEDPQPVGAMIMAKHQVEVCSPKIGKRHAFKVDSGEGLPLYLAADTEELTNKWLNVLKKATTQGNTWLDKSSRNLYKTPSSITRPDCCGYLMKLGSKWSGWTRRYCVLKDACLYFFQDINVKTALGMSCLHGYKVASISTSALGKRYSFEIMPPEPKLRHYYFHTESEMEKKRWISALEYSIDRWIKSG